MNDGLITENMKFWMARMMNVRWAAKIHKIPLDLPLQDLNTVAKNAK